MFTAALFAIPRYGSDLSAYLQMDKQDVIHTHTYPMEYCSAIKQNFAICSNMSGLGGHVAK